MIITAWRINDKQLGEALRSAEKKLRSITLPGGEKLGSGNLEESPFVETAAERVERGTISYLSKWGAMRGTRQTGKRSAFNVTKKRGRGRRR